MRRFNILCLFGIAWMGSAFFPAGDDDRLAIYSSLDTLADILTTVRDNSPGQVNAQHMVESAIEGLLEQLDPHSGFYNVDQYRTMREDQQGSFYGVGIIVGYQKNYLTVISPVQGTPAFEAGMRAGDMIVAIDGENTEGLDVTGGIRLLRGEKGTEVVLTVQRPGLDQPIIFTIERAEIPSNNVRTSFMLDEKTGYVALKDFGDTATEELSAAIQSLDKQGMAQLMLDLRGNPGGLLPQAIGVASLFLPGGKLIVSTKGRLQETSQDYYSEYQSPLKQMPLIVLIDRGSASASEIVAGAIQDHDRGLILGVSSWGKGLVQSVFPMDKGTKGLALTTSRYYTPSGRNIQGKYDSIEEYYNPTSSESFYFGNRDNFAGKIFKTEHGRDVLEVRGITPDVYISFPQLAEDIQTMEAKNRFFDFAAEHQDDYSDIDQNWRSGDQVFTDFTAWLASRDEDPAGLGPNREVVLQKITYQMLYIHDMAWAWQYLMRVDNQVSAAMDLFNQAQELLAVYKGEAELRETYDNELRHFAKLNQPTNNP